MLRLALMLTVTLWAGTAAAQHAHHHSGGTPGGAVPTSPGQDAFGAVAEVARILLADPKTDWSRVSLDRLRDHLIDMHEVTLNALVVVEPIPGGFSARVTGQGRTRDAIGRMVPTHAAMMNGKRGWTLATEALPDGVRLTVVSDDQRQTLVIRGLGFIGIMASGDHHQPHHLEMARGTFSH